MVSLVSRAIDILYIRYLCIESTSESAHVLLILSMLLYYRYKTPDDKPLNEFGFGEKFLNAAEAKKVIAETNESWKKLRSGAAKAGKLWTGVTADVN